MAKQTKRKAADKALEKARIYCENKKYENAFASFSQFLKCAPHRKQEVYLEFSIVTKERSDELEEKGDILELMNYYNQAMEVYPDHDVILNNIGAQLFRIGFIDWAAWYLRKAVSVNPAYLAARDNLENVSSHIVERWHFPMLNDVKRNQSYRLAILRAIETGYNTVLDIGTGTGLLSIFSCCSNAKRVTACDESGAMIEVAREVLAANRSSSVRLVHKSSLDMHIPRDMPEKVKLVVTEIFDAGLFGEHIVSTVCHAWRNLLAPDGKVLPHSATMYAAGIECVAIRTSNRLVYPALMHVDLGGVNLVSTVGRRCAEPYTTENLSLIKGGYKFITDTQQLLQVNFQNVDELERMSQGQNWVSKLTVKEYARLDAVAVWFDLHLEEHFTLSTAVGNSCWEHAIFPITSLKIPGSNAYASTMMQQGEVLETTFHFQQDRFSLQKFEVCEGPELKKSVSRPFWVAAFEDSRPHHRLTEKQWLLTGQQFQNHFVPFRFVPASPLKRTCFCSRRASVSDEWYTNAGNYSDDSSSESDPETSENSIWHPNTLCYKEGAGDTWHSIDDDSDKDSNKDGGDGSQQEGAVGCDPPKPELENYGILPAGSKTDDDVSENLSAIHLGKNLSAEKHEHSTQCYQFGCIYHEREAAAIRDAESRRTEKFYYTEEPESPPVPKKITLEAEMEDIQYINDIYYNTQLCRSITKYREDHCSKPLSLCCITPRLSFLPIQAIKIGYHSVTIATPRQHHRIIQKVAELNGCSLKLITMVDIDEFKYPKSKVDVIVCDVVEPCGALRQNTLENIFSHSVGSLTDSGIILPQRVKVHGVFIESKELEKYNRVSDCNTIGIDIAEYINIYQARNHINIEPVMLPNTILSDSVEMFTVDFAAITTDNVDRVLRQNLEKSVRIIQRGEVTALMYWFELSLYGGFVVSTLDTRCHWKQAAVMMPEEIIVEEGQKYIAQMMLQNSCLDVKLIAMQEKGKKKKKK